MEVDGATGKPDTTISMATRITNNARSGAAFFKRSQTFLGANLAKTQALAVPEEKRTQRFVILCWILMLLLGVIIGVLYVRLPNAVPLFYSRAWGRERLAQPYFLFLPLILSIVFIFSNAYFASKVGDFNFLKKVLILGAAVSALLSIITVSRILILII